MVKDIRKVAVIGGGTMGSGIGQLIAQKGLTVVVKETDSNRAEECRARVFKQLERISVNPQLKPEAEVAKTHFSTTSSYDDLRGSDLVIEAVFEDLESKRSVFRELASLLPEEVVFTSNSSSLSIDEMALSSGRPDRFIGSHFFNPAPKTLLVELVRGKDTSDETYETVRRFIEVNLKRTTILVKGCPGYLVNRILMPYANEAVNLLTQTTLTIKQIDSRAKRFGWLMGPFELIDYVGIDIAANVADILYAGYGERARPNALMNRMIKLGRLGKKVGAGFYVGSDTSSFEEILARECPERIGLDIEEGFCRIMAGLYNEAFLCLQEGIASSDVIETGAALGIMFPMALEGPLHYAQEKYGLANLLADLKRFEARYGIRFKPAPILEQFVAEGRMVFQANEEEEW